MFSTKFGPFNGSTWESLCQQVFKRKYQVECYQQMQASPGDFGIEGYTSSTGWAFQCYCPEKHYERTELYEKQRDKITADLRKLKDYEVELQARLGSTKISRWVFVTPEVDRNALLAHAKTKESEVRGWNLPILAADFTVLLHDGDHYLVEINEVRTAAGEALVFDDAAPALAALTGEQEQYEQNVHRKSGLRLADRAQRPDFQTRVQQLSQRTIEQFLEADGYFRRIASASPVTHMRLVRLINEYEQYVIETSAIWSGTAEELTAKIRDGLATLVSDELAPEFDKANALKVARYMTARWLAVCELDYG
ncbi:hypothetical protein [Rhizobacter sp. Root404]|uniref:hypothetical protein n=1 Tax=Rhizobacter sp. Root404 TaxID=1736528 RepID=UPI0006F8EB5F|nr:hypothetical protein [Rhizobacter sp. Root404]KQW37103.1 hypothetical protein ASC76_18190 [Rhizobacter sp. Root404]